MNYFYLRNDSLEPHEIASKEEQKIPWQVLRNLESLKSFRRTTEISDTQLSIMSRNWYECEKTKEGLW